MPMHCKKRFICMDTVVTIQIISGESKDHLDAEIDKAVAMFYQVERICTRFDPESELMKLSSQTGVWVSVSRILYSAIRFAVETARETGGAFDPSIGRKQEQRGFNENYLSGKTISSEFADVENTSYRDIIIDDKRQAVLLKKQMVIDLGAVAKGLAIDLAAQELHARSYKNFLINAGGDLYASGSDENGEPWIVGIRHPIRNRELAGTIRLTDAAICTSGDYERLSPVLPGENHILDPHKNQSPDVLASCTVIAPFAMLADSFSTAAFVMGMDSGVRKMEKMNLDCLMISRSMSFVSTKKFKEKWSWQD
ncbi:FAD:protein FMN transferase [Sporolactobacillus shoreae]|nr:FAD:protein FMN transferase [Sporolactobacillus shoreae]